MDNSSFDYNINPDLLQVVQWNTTARWVRFLDGKKRLVKPGEHLIVANSGEALEAIEKIVVH